MNKHSVHIFSAAYFNNSRYVSVSEKDVILEAMHSDFCWAPELRCESPVCGIMFCPRWQSCSVVNCAAAMSRWHTGHKRSPQCLNDTLLCNTQHSMLTTAALKASLNKKLQFCLFTIPISLRFIVTCQHKMVTKDTK